MLDENEIMRPEMFDTQSFLGIKEEWDKDDFTHVDIVSEEQAHERKFLHATVFFGGKTKITDLVVIGRTCNVIQNNFCVKRDVMVCLSQQKLIGFDGSCSKVIEKYDIIVKQGKRQFSLPCHVVNHAMHPFLRYPSLIKLGVVVNSVRDCLVGSGGDVFV